MNKAIKYRQFIPEARRIVIKIGSRVLVQKTGRPDVRRMKMLAKEIAAVQKAGHEVVIITSGAIGTGMEALGMKERPKSVPDLQMAAAVGQCRLMTRYDQIFGALGCRVGQILLTHADFKHMVCLTNAKRTLLNLLKNKVIPVINENDATADEEIRADMSLGDNDYLASLVVKLIRADLLIILSTVNGVLMKKPNGRSERISYIETVNRAVYKLVNATSSNLSKGGMESKLKAAHEVSKSGCTVVIANGRETGVIGSVMAGKDKGTLILSSGM